MALGAVSGWGFQAAIDLGAEELDEQAVGASSLAPTMTSTALPVNSQVARDVALALGGGSVVIRLVLVLGLILIGPGAVG